MQSSKTRTNSGDCSNLKFSRCSSRYHLARRCYPATRRDSGNCAEMHRNCLGLSTYPGKPEFAMVRSGQPFLTFGRLPALSLAIQNLRATYSSVNARFTRLPRQSYST